MSDDDEEYNEGRGALHGRKLRKKMLQNKTQTGRLELDGLLPDGLQTTWTQCSLCLKWRNLPSHLVPEGDFECPMFTEDSR